MDDPAVEAGQLDRALRFIRRVNRLLGYNRATLSHLESFSRSWKRGAVIRILDLATGSADVPLAIQRWATHRGWDLRLVGLDLHDKTIAAARSAIGCTDRILLVRGDALRVPFPDRSFDYVIASMFLHHLSEPQQLRLLREMDRVSARGVILADLLRSRAAYRWISLMTLASSPIIRHDARVSIAQALNKTEILALREAARLPYLQYHAHAAYRFILSGEKR